MLKLEYRFALYVPSKDKDGVPIARHDACEKVVRYFSDNLGGATVIDGRGAYVMESGELVTEPISIVYGYGVNHRFAHQLIQFAGMMRQDWNQETVAIEIPDGLLLVDENEKVVIHNGHSV